MRILNNLLEGLVSLGRLGGDNSLFNDYLKGDNASDLRKDWEAIGNDMRKVLVLVWTNLVAGDINLDSSL